MRIHTNSRPADYTRGIQPMDKETEMFWNLRQDRSHWQSAKELTAVHKDIGEPNFLVAISYVVAGFAALVMMYILVEAIRYA